MQTLRGALLVILIAIGLLAPASRPAVAAHSRATRPATIDSVAAFRARAANQAFKDALALEQQGKAVTAISAYREVVRQDSTYPEANFRMGRLLAGLDRVPEAVHAYRDRKSTRLNSSHQ